MTQYAVGSIEIGRTLTLLRFAIRVQVNRGEDGGQIAIT
jgi:predicted amidohydrolase